MQEQRLKFFSTQTEFAQAVFSGLYRFLLFGGAIRGGKSYVVFALTILLARMYPGSRWAIVRKDLPTIKRVTIPTFNSMKMEPFVGPINQSTWMSKCKNGSEILFFSESIKLDPDYDRWKGLEVNGFILEECNELAEKTFAKAIERVGSWTCKSGKQPLPLILMTCNPAPNWVKRLFYDPWSKGILKAPFYFLPSKISDNPHLDPEFVKNQEHLKVVNRKIYDRFVVGRWDVEDDPEQLILFEYILTAKGAEHIPGPGTLGVDVARFGDDSTVFADYDGNRLFKIEVHENLRIDETADKVQAKINVRALDPVNVKVDTVGLGAGVADNLEKEGYAVTAVVGGARPIEREEKTLYTFFNLRSQIWWEYREGLRKGEILLDVDDQELIEDLIAPRYSISGDKVLRVESKEATKRRLGRSPDAGDAAVYGYADVVRDDHYPLYMG